jgi:hypothetical protein
MARLLWKDCVGRHAVCQGQDQSTYFGVYGFPRDLVLPSGLDGAFRREAPKCTELSRLLHARTYNYEVLATWNRKLCCGLLEAVTIFNCKCSDQYGRSKHCYSYHAYDLSTFPFPIIPIILSDALSHQLPYQERICNIPAPPQGERSKDWMLQRRPSSWTLS